MISFKANDDKGTWISKYPTGSTFENVYTTELTAVTKKSKYENQINNKNIENYFKKIIKCNQNNEIAIHH